MKIVCYKSSLLLSNFYVILSEGRSILIDPAVIDINLELDDIDYIFLSHEHYDHISGVNYFKEKYPNAQVICSKKCSENLISPSKNLSLHFDAFCKIQTWINNQEEVKPIVYTCNADIVFSQYFKMVWNKHVIEMFYTPGHSEGSSIYVIDGIFMFSGDILFKNYPTFTSLYKNGKKDFNNITLPLINTFNKNMEVYPGHFESFYLWQSDYYKG